MCQLFKTEKFIAEHTSLGSEAKWLHWERIFSNLLSCSEDLTSENMFQFRINYVSLRIFMCINESSDYTHTFSVLDALFITQRSKNVRQTYFSLKNSTSGRTHLRISYRS
ncbi:hypothetical protein CEXT_226421 [Caerostris extrusa]|uniref:Uncharacterized protein n=1 Tax=Caerostris extrusa TaxID=172846 RepID=A0AAV4XF87_CAEEX|nr:hypothetical protein CEXT_226421 [Caerostris extrusa]